MAMPSKLCLTVLTFVPDWKTQLRPRLPHLIESLKQSEFPGHVAIIDDCSTDEEHLKYLDGLESEGFQVVRRTDRGGISKGKNTCLRVMRDRDFDFGFIMEDDMEVSPGWWDIYARAHARTGIHHFSWASDSYFSDMKKSNMRIGKDRIMRCSRLNGCLLTVTPRMIGKVGGFKVMPRKWGYEHIQYTDRCIRAKLAPFYADVPDSNNYVRLSVHSRFTFIPHRDRVVANKANYAAGRSRAMFEPITE